MFCDAHDDITSHHIVQKDKDKDIECAGNSGEGASAARGAWTSYFVTAFIQSSLPKEIVDDIRSVIIIMMRCHCKSYV